MEIHTKRPGSIRLNDQQYQEMKQLGLANESAYVRYKMEQGQQKLKGLHQPEVKPSSEVQASDRDVVKDQLTIQRLSMENAKLLEKIERMTEDQQETLNGVPHKVHSMLQEELQKRDFERLKELDKEQKKQLEKLESKLEKKELETQEKQKEIEALVKKLGFVELGKALLPSAISGLSKQYPSQMKGIAGTLGRLGLAEATDAEEGDFDEQEEQLSHICNYLQGVTTPEQYQELMELLFHLGEQLKIDSNILQKISYYLQQLTQKRQQQESKNNSATDTM